MFKDKFKGISIKGRVAYGISCLENLIIYYNYMKDDWIIVLNQLWDFTSRELLDDWFYEMAEFLPEGILEFDKYIESNFEYIDEKQYLKLYNVYSDANEVIRKIIQLIFDIVSAELYGKIQGDSSITLVYLNEIIDLCKDEGAELPDIKKYERYDFKEERGWGSSFEGRKMSRILK